MQRIVEVADVLGEDVTEQAVSHVGRQILGCDSHEERLNIKTDLRTNSGREKTMIQISAPEKIQ